jgi:hypothetical protein
VKPIPTKIGGAQVVRWTPIDMRHEPTEACRHRIGSEQMPPASGLAICRYDNEPGFYLFYCDDAWKEITDTWHETLEEAMEQAQFEVHRRHVHVGGRLTSRLTGPLARICSPRPVNVSVGRQ